MIDGDSMVVRVEFAIRKKGCSVGANIEKIKLEHTMVICTRRWVVLVTNRGEVFFLEGFATVRFGVLVCHVIG